MTIDIDMEDIVFDRTNDEIILEDGKYLEGKYKGLRPVTTEKFNFKEVTHPKTNKKVIVHLFGNNNYFIAQGREIRDNSSLKVFGYDLIKKDSPDLYICDSILDAVFLNQELGLDAVSIFEDIKEIKNSYEIFDNKDIYFVSSTNKFDGIKDDLNLSKAYSVKFDTSITEHFQKHGNIQLINDYLLGCKSPNGIEVTDFNAILKSDMISKRSAGYSTGFKQVDKQTQGLSCDMIALGSGTGCGKTTLACQILATLIKQGVKCGAMFFEQADDRETINNIAGHFDNINYNYLFGSQNADVDFDYEFEEMLVNDEPENEEVSITDEQRDTLIEKHLRPTITKIKDRLEVMTNDNEVQDVEDALRMVRSLVVQKGCKAIFLDHTTYLTDGVENQNKAAQILMQGLMQIKNRHNINIFYITHLRKSKTGGTHEEGARVTLDDFAGGKASTQYCTIALGLERDMFNEDKEIADITNLRILKRRGMSVKHDSVTKMKFDLDTNKLYPENCHKPKSKWKS